MAHNRTPMSDVEDDDTFWVGTPEQVAAEMQRPPRAGLQHLHRRDGGALRRGDARALDRRGEADGGARLASARVTRGAWSPGSRLLTAGLVFMVTVTAFEGLAVPTVLPATLDEFGGLPLYGWAFAGFFLASLVGITVAGLEADRRGVIAPLLVGAAALRRRAAGVRPGGRHGVGRGGSCDPGPRRRRDLLDRVRDHRARLRGGRTAADDRHHLQRLGDPRPCRARRWPAMWRRRRRGAGPSWRWCRGCRYRRCCLAGPLSRIPRSRPRCGCGPPGCCGGRRACAWPRHRPGAGRADDRQPAGSGSSWSSPVRAVALAPLRRLLPAGALTAAPGRGAAVAVVAMRQRDFPGAEAFVPLAISSVRSAGTVAGGLALTAAARDLGHGLMAAGQVCRARHRAPGCWSQEPSSSASASASRRRSRSPHCRSGWLPRPGLSPGWGWAWPTRPPPWSSSRRPRPARRAPRRRPRSWPTPSASRSGPDWRAAWWPSAPPASAGSRQPSLSPT